MPERSGGLERASRVDSPGRAKKGNDRVRTCAEPGCVTKLSRYNNHEYCWVHEDPDFNYGRVKTK